MLTIDMNEFDKNVIFFYIPNNSLKTNPTISKNIIYKNTNILVGTFSINQLIILIH